jgi:hypothetical protein
VTKPHDQEQPNNRRPPPSSCKKPSWIDCGGPMRILRSMRCSYIELTDTEVPIKSRLLGSARPNIANHGCQCFQCNNCRRITSPSTPSNPRQVHSPVSSKSPNTASRSLRSSSRAAASANGHWMRVTMLSSPVSSPMRRRSLRV